MSTPAHDATLPLDDGAGDGAARVRRFWLVVTEGPDAGTRHLSTGERVVVGTHESAELVLHDDTVSRFHCEIEISADAAVLRDLGSRNGTTVDGVRSLAVHLGDGAVVRVGRTALRFELRGDEVAMALSAADRFGSLVGKSVAMRRVFSVLERAATTDAAVLLEGETGTGKEAAAESLHVASARRERPFLVVDCSAIPGDLLEAELFGHEKGAFTGATSAREGIFEAARGGTVFLDEIGELGPELQPKLLRVLEKKQVKRIGNARHEPVDVRIVAATNRNLREEVNEKRFRSDLYYRIAVVSVRLPALRERPEDLPLLAEHLLRALGASGAGADALLEPGSIAAFARHRWSGNVRELRNYLERCLALKERVPLLDGAEAASHKLPDFDKPLKAARELWTRTLEQRYVEELLRRHDGNVSAAARAAGVDRMHFYRLLWRYGLR
jgi:transcriptional regulator with PAS, ATPase and Fis domain